VKGQDHRVIKCAASLFTYERNSRDSPM